MIGKYHFRRSALLFLVMVLNPALAALPPTMDYQGHLTDNAGAPVDATVNMSFRIYNVEAGGAVLWSSTLPLTVQQGVFSVELGGAVPFPLGLFEQPLWIGLEVDSDGEMTPRRPITSNGFAFKADDANTLEGVSASTLDQSAHVSDMANPHNVTAAQVGAADLNELATHIANSANPHSVTAAQTGAATSGDFSAHTGNASAHHPRYTNGEAVSAMGAKSDSNALNHDRYTNANAVAAILAADGAGSTLDADKVDGLQANEIIDAAQDEVRTPIDHLPFIINSPGSYYFTGNLTGSTGITVNADNVTIDLMGFTLSGDGATASAGIRLNGSNAEVRNGTVSNFGWHGIYAPGSTRNHRILNMRLVDNGGSGVVFDVPGPAFIDASSLVSGCTASGNANYGIWVGPGNATVEGNVATENGNSGILILNGRSTITNNVANHNNAAGITVGGGVVVTSNVADSNGGDGINSSVSGVTMINNSVSFNGGHGINCWEHCTITNNTVSKNNNGGISAGNGTAITGNNVTENQHWGIYALAGATIKDNTVFKNNQSDTAGEGGIYVYFGVQAKGNTIVDNKQNDVYVFGRYNTLEENLLVGSVYGIWFQSNYQNFYANNRASNNTTNYGNTGSVTDGGGNASF